MDTCGFLYSLFIHEANLHDTTRGVFAIKKLDKKIMKNIHYILADKGYRKTFITECCKLNLVTSIADNSESILNHDKTFHLDPTRWVVERTLAWITQARRLVIIYEKTISSQETFIWLTMMHLGIKKLVNSTKIEVT